MHNRKIAALTLGCKVNQQETESIVTLFSKNGYIKTNFDEMADVYLINTCTVTHLGDRKSRQMIRRAVLNNPNAVVVVTGCYAQRDSQEILKIPGVDIVIGTKNRAMLPGLVEKVRQNKGEQINAVNDIMVASEFEEISSVELQTGRVRAYLKIQEGCNQFCSYCIIPYTRGPVRSRSVDSVLQEAKALTASGHKEIVLTGIHTAAYGMEGQEAPDLGDLVNELVKIPELLRLRISSIDPHEFGEKLLDTIVVNPKVCPHFHIPLQSGSDRILKLMNRPYHTEFYRNIIKRLRSLIEGVAITTDIIVGFPGETDADFEESVAFVTEMAFSGMHIFKYSPRSGTPAADFPNQVSAETKEGRSKKLLFLSNSMWKSYSEGFLGKDVEVLVEQRNSKGFWEGHTPHYLKVLLKSSKNLRGEIVGANATALGNGFLEGELVDSNQ